MTMDVSRRNFLLASSAAMIGAGTIASTMAGCSNNKTTNKTYTNPNPGPDPVCPIPGDYEYCKDFSDEFYGNALNDTKWWDFNPSWNCRKPCLFSRDNVTVKDDNLKLTCSLMKQDEITPEMDIRGYNKYWTSYVKSIKKISYGYFEIRAKSMKANVCNAFWLYDPFSDRPDLKYTDAGGISEEIDIVEMFGKPDTKVSPENDHILQNVCHACKTPYLEGIINKSKQVLPNNANIQHVDFEFYEDYHTYALEWTPAKLVWYMDGNVIFQRDNDVFHRPLHVCLDCEIQNSWAGNPLDEDLPATFDIDYVHVFKLKGKSEIADFKYENLQQPGKQA